MMATRYPAVLVLALWGSEALAGPVEDKIVAQLQSQGFARVEISRTWLGRTRIEAYKDGLEREIIVNPRTGEILRDYWEREDDDDEEGSEGEVSIVDPDHEEDEDADDDDGSDDDGDSDGDEDSDGDGAGDGDD